MLPSGCLSDTISAPLHGILRNDVLKPASLGFMKEVTEEEVTKQTELSTIIDDNLKLLETVPLPDVVKFEEISKLLKKRIKKDMKKDPLHSTAVKLTNYANNFYEKMEPYFDEVFDFDKKLRESFQSDLFAISKEYIMSDLSPSYLRTLTLSYLTQCRYLEVFDFRIRRERIKLITVRNNYTKFKRVCEKHNRWVEFLERSSETMIDSRIRLVWYVDLNNCRTVKEAFKIKELRKTNLNEEQYFGLLLDLQNQTEELRNRLIQLNRNIFQVTPDREDPTVDLLCNVMEIMNM